MQDIEFCFLHFEKDVDHMGSVLVLLEESSEVSVVVEGQLESSSDQGINAILRIM